MTITRPETARPHARHVTLITLSLGLLALTAGCVTTTPNPTISTEPVIAGTRYVLATATVLPPTGGGWVQVATHDALHRRLFFLKKLASPSHHLIADLTEVTVTQPIQNVKDVHTHIVAAGLTDYAGSDDYKFIKQSLEQSKRWGTVVYKADYLVHDYQAPGRGDAAFLITRSHGYIVQHPRQSNLFIVVSYQERGHEQELSPESDFATTAEAFCATLQLQD